MDLASECKAQYCNWQGLVTVALIVCSILFLGMALGGLYKGHTDLFFFGIGLIVAEIWLIILRYLINFAWGRLANNQLLKFNKIQLLILRIMIFEAWVSSIILVVG